ncbi:SAP domain-containing protein [Thioalkalivibrio denitrificans]|uniref:SAP domain-containing protein n=1 Tax=Thioalkalivibrio denitrificans TaxID=108003 RepID=A0A1V3NFG7_9GAMM|nr:SAP domain-containing protein [Thioalkalivibrio denitrificans]OOG23775.1 SAP domain-containing protein [Thioalkalivibrio denitrificans]
MNVASIREIARGMEISIGKLNKADLIRQIQKMEGNFPCFGTALNGVCDQTECLWREDCLAGAARPKVEG